MEFVVEPSRKIEVMEDVDVLIVGGGPGGVPAAVAAARKGLSVLIVERYGFFGGLATAGLIGPLFGYAEEDKELRLGGIPVEIVRRMQALGGVPDPSLLHWDSIPFVPELLKHVLDGILQDAGVKILLHSYATDVVMKDDAIDAVIFESKSGRKAIRARMVVDATGDGDIAALAGEDFTFGRKADGLTQSMGSKFIIGGVARDSDELKPENLELLKDAIRTGKLNTYQLIFTQEVSEGGISMRFEERTPTVTRCKGSGIDVRDLTRAELKIRRDSLEFVNFYREHIHGYENAFLRQSPAQVGVRETRQIAGMATLCKDDVLNKHKQPETTIARGNWFFDIHCPRGLRSEHVEENGMCSMRCRVEPVCYMKTKFADQMLDRPHWGEPGYYDIPYGTIVPRKTRNLLISGRCISADHFAMSSARVIGTCFALGEAAGTAAAMSLAQDIAPAKLNVGELQAELGKAGVPLGND